MDALRNVLPQVLQKRGLKTQANAALVVFRSEQWLREVLPGLAEAISVEKFDGNILSIRCKNSVALQECAHRSPRLKSYLLESCRDVVPPTISVRFVRE